MNRKQRRTESKQGRPASTNRSGQVAIARLQEVLAEAIRHHQAGRLGEAEQRYRWILGIEPRHAEALHLLGTLAHDVGRHSAALDLISQAIAQNGTRASFHDSLGTVFLALRRFDEAVGSYRCALALRPDSAHTHYNLGIALRGQGRLAEAASSFRQALALAPEDVQAQTDLGNVLKEQGLLGEAVAAYHRAITINPKYAMAHFNLGVAFRDQGRLDEAVASYRLALEHQPDLVAAHYNLGNIWQDLGGVDEAAACYRAVLSLNPGFAEAHNNLGIVLQEKGELDAAVACFGRALASKPGFAAAHNNRAGALQEQGRLDEAIAAYAEALVHQPDYAEAAMGRAFAQLYRSGVRLADILTEARAVNDVHFASLCDRPPADVASDPARALPRIGFVSADFRGHAVGALALPAIEGLTRAGFHVTCYSNGTRMDAVTDRFIAAATAWRAVAKRSDDALAEAIRTDAIDILVDLSGFSAGNRLSVFARKPAPVQASWIGYPATTGVTAIDYIIADRFQLPPAFDPFYSEAVIRLPNAYIAFAPLDDAPLVDDLPALSQQAITFGSFNALKKLTPEVVAVWSDLLTKLPDSRLLLKAPALTCPVTRQRYAAQFAAQGISEDRLIFAGRTTRVEHLALMRTVDIALDSFPYSGGQTTLEALWMGLPVITLPGETFASRHALSYLSVIGLSELVASGTDDYVRLAVKLAQDFPGLVEMRSSLRARMLASPLSDRDRFVGDISAAFMTMWQRFRSGDTPVSVDLRGGDPTR